MKILTMLKFIFVEKMKKIKLVENRIFGFTSLNKSRKKKQQVKRYYIQFKINEIFMNWLKQVKYIKDVIIIQLIVTGK